MSRTALFVSSAIAFVALAQPSIAAAVPEQLGLTARVVDAGAPISGSHTVVVRLHGEAAGGTPRWTESHAVVATDGLIYVNLGTITPLTDTIVDGGPLWIELQVDSTVLTPRLTVASTAYAIRAGVAEDAERLAGQPATAFAAAAHAHAGQYLPVGTALACVGTAKVSAIDPSGSVVCSPDAVGPTYVAGPGITFTGASIAASFGGSGSAAAAARADHNHAGVYLPVGPTLSCPAGQFQTAIQPSGSVSCATPPQGDITDVIAGAGLTGGAATGSVSLAVAFGGTGSASTAARSDHSHAAQCPTAYTLHGSPGATTPLCSKRVTASGTWNTAATACYTAHAGGRLCTYSELRIAATTAPAEVLSPGYWMGDRPEDDWVLRVNSTDVNNFDEKIEIVATNVVSAGYYCCTTAN